MINNEPDVQTTCESRAVIYSFLADIFSSPPTPQAVAGIRQMAEAMEMDCTKDWTASELEKEYMNLFVVPNRRYVAPYESVFRDQWLMPPVLKPGSDPGEASQVIKGLVMGESAFTVRRIYRKAGIQPSNDLPDHISNELRFLAYLSACEAEDQSPESSPFTEQRAAFTHEHLLKWIDLFREKIARNDRSGYYLTAIQVTEAMLAGETFE